MAFVSMMMVFIVIVFIILGILLISGLIFLIVGIVNKRKPKYIGKKSPTICIIVGSILLILPILTFTITIIGGITSSVSTIIKRTDYECITDKWRNERVSEDEAAEEAIKELLTAADSKNYEMFKKIFTPNIQQTANFNNSVDNFFDAYPIGLSKCELDGNGVSSTSSFNYGHNVQTGTTGYSCTLNGEWYYIHIKFCYDNTDNPNDVGVTLFYIENLEANALDMDYKGKYLECNIKTDKEVTARLIMGKSFIFEPYPERIITEEQMVGYLEKYNDLYHLANEIGMPNVTKKYNDGRGPDYFYELYSENGEPRYAYICANTFGNFLYGHICSDKKCFYEKELFSNQ